MGGKAEGIYICPRERDRDRERHIKHPQQFHTCPIHWHIKTGTSKHLELFRKRALPCPVRTGSPTLRSDPGQDRDNGHIKHLDLFPESALPCAVRTGSPTLRSGPGQDRDNGHIKHLELFPKRDLPCPVRTGSPTLTEPRTDTSNIWSYSLNVIFLVLSGPDRQH